MAQTIPWALLTVPAPAKPTPRLRRVSVGGSPVHSALARAPGSHLRSAELAEVPGLSGLRLELTSLVQRLYAITERV